MARGARGAGGEAPSLSAEVPRPPGGGIPGGIRRLLPLVPLVLLKVGLDCALLLTDPLRFRHWEEAYNATVGLVVASTGRWDHLLPLQYKTFCGGCTVHAITAAPVLSLLGDHFLAWKALAVLWGVATMLVGFVAVDRLAGRPAAWAWAILFAVPPLGLAELSLMRWGNHAETVLFVVGALALLRADRPVSLGLVLGLSAWFCRTSLYLLVGLAPFVLARPDRLRVLAGVALGLSPLLLPAARGDSGAYLLHPRHHLLPQGWPGLLDRWETLLEPGELRARGWRLAGPAVPWVVLAAAALALPGLRRVPAVAALVASFVLAVGVTGFPIFIAKTWTPLTNSRYHSPWLFLLTLLVAVAVTGRRRSWIPAALLLGANLAAWAPRLVGETVDRRAFTLPATDLVHFAADAGTRFAPDALAYARDPRVAGTLQRIAGREAAVGPLRWGPLTLPETAAGRFGLGQGLATGRWSPERYHALLVDLPAEARADIGLGLGVELALQTGARVGEAEAAVARARAYVARGWTGEGPSPLSAAAGVVAVAACGGSAPELPPAFGSCLRRAGLTGPELVGAGIVAARPDRLDLPDLGPDFEAGTRHVAAGLDQPVDGARLAP